MVDKKQYIVQANENGQILISEDVISTIVYHALTEVEGFGGLTIRNHNEFTPPLSAKNWHKGIRVVINEKGSLFLEINTLVLYGANIVTVAQNIQNSVTEILTSTIGIAPKRVHVNINGIIRK